MSFELDIPASWNRDPAPPLPDLGSVDPHRIASMVNRFIAAKQDALFTALDAFNRQTGADAVDGAPTVLDRLAELRQSTLDLARDDNERALLGPRLDLHVDDARDGIDRHVTKQQDALARQIISERQTLIQRAAELDHNNDDKLAGLAEAHASAAQELARLDGAPEQPAAESARSAIWRTALGQHLAAGDGAQAIALFDRIKDRLVPGDRRALDGPIANAATNVATDAWIAREDARTGEPLDARASADPALSPLERATIMAKVAVRDSAREARRVATVMGTADKLGAATRAIATAPATYRPGTIAALASAYEEAGEPAKAANARHIARLEGALLPFARSSAERQQRFIDSLLEDDPTRAAAEAIQRHQAEAFARDPYAAGTALYPDVGKPVPIDDIAGRVTQARKIATARGIPVAPFTADEIAAMPQDARLTLANALPDDVKAAIVPVRATLDDAEPLPDGTQIAQAPRAPLTAEEIIERRKQSVVPREVIEEQYRQQQMPRREGNSTEPLPGSRDYERAMRVARRYVASEKGTTVEPTPDTPEYQKADLERRRLEVEAEKGGVEPPSGTRVHAEAADEAARMQNEGWPGVKVTLPNGEFIEDLKSPTGYLMAPVNNLKSVAADARRSREKLPPLDLNSDTTVAQYVGALESVLRENLAQGGTYDDQRRRGPTGKDGFVQLRQFRNIANVNVGLFCQQLSLNWYETMIISGLYAIKNSRNSSLFKPYFLDDDTKKYIDVGYKLGESKQFDADRQ